MNRTERGTRNSVNPSPGNTANPRMRQMKPDAVAAEIRRSTSTIPAYLQRRRYIPTAQKT